jgi:hypothetical protein
MSFLGSDVCDPAGYCMNEVRRTRLDFQMLGAWRMASDILTSFQRCYRAFSGIQLSPTLFFLIIYCNIYIHPCHTPPQLVITPLLPTSLQARIRPVAVVVVMHLIMFSHRCQLSILNVIKHLYPHPHPNPISDARLYL